MEHPMALSLTRPTVAEPRENASGLAFEAVFRLHFRGVWRTLRRLGVANAYLDDAAQDVFVVVHAKLAGFDGRSLRGWLYAIAVRVASDYRREALRRATAPLDETLTHSAPDPARQNELHESVCLLHSLLAELDVEKRTVFVLGELEELRVPEIAEALGVNLNTVYSRLRAARAEFDAALTRHRKRQERSNR
jgi:RNA polymerase sigma-70 factor (ECF subfamily)